MGWTERRLVSKVQSAGDIVREIADEARLVLRQLAGCIAEGLVGGEGFAVDASLIKAEASRQKGVEGSKGLLMRGQAIDLQYLRFVEMGCGELTNDEMAQRVVAIPRG
jgi:hypothetical protein